MWVLSGFTRTIFHQFMHHQVLRSLVFFLAFEYFLLEQKHDLYLCSLQYRQLLSFLLNLRDKHHKVLSNRLDCMGPYVFALYLKANSGERLEIALMLRSLSIRCGSSNIKNRASWSDKIDRDITLQFISVLLWITFDGLLKDAIVITIISTLSDRANCRTCDNFSES